MTTRLDRLTGADMSERPALPDGTVPHVPIGEVRADDEMVCCHLCGRWFRSVAAHLPSHGWTRQQYLDCFGLEQGAALEGPETRRRRAAGFAPRRRLDRRVLDGVAAGHELARSGRLAELAAEAARGRPHPPQRRAKTLAALEAISAENQAAANRRRRQVELARVADQVASRLGFDSVGDLVEDRLSRGHSLAATSRECGLHKDWLQRHLAAVAPHTHAWLLERRRATTGVTTS